MKPSPFNIRVWDSVARTMMNNDEVIEWRYLKILLSQDDSKALNIRMRSVGFCDRKGVEIYQKDYVKIFSEKFGNKIELVDWIPQLAKFGWGGCTPGGTPHSFSIGNAASIFEVVGNDFQGLQEGVHSG